MNLFYPLAAVLTSSTTSGDSSPRSGAFRLEQRSDVKTVSRQFDGAHVAFAVVAADDQREALQIDDEFRIDAEVAVVAFMGVQAAVGPCDAGVRLENDVAGFSTSEQLSGAITSRPPLSVSA